MNTRLFVVVNIWVKKLHEFQIVCDFEYLGEKNPRLLAYLCGCEYLGE